MATNATSKLTLLTVVTVNGVQQLKQVQVSVGQLSNAAAASAKSFQGLNSASNILAKSLSNIRGTVVGLGTAMLTIGTFKLFGSSIKEAVDFEAQMANVSTILQSSSVTLEDLKRDIIALGGDLGSSSEQAEALYAALSTNVEAVDAVQFVADTAKFAKANLVDLGDATLLIATTMNTFGKAAGSVAHVTDVMSETIRVGAVTGQQLVASLGTVINTAALAKVAFEDITAAVATLTSVGVPAQQATVAINQAMLGFISPSEKALKNAEALRAKGVELTAAFLQENGLVGAMNKLAIATDSLADSEKTALIADLFGEIRAFKAIAGLTGEQLDKFTASSQKMKTGVDGLTDSMFKLQKESTKLKLEEAWNNFNKAVNEVWNNVLNNLVPVILDATKTAINYVNVYKAEGFSGILLTVAENHRELATAITAVGIAIAGVALINWINALGGLVGILGAVRGAFAGLNLAMFTQGFVSLSTTVLAAVNNFGLFTTLGLFGLFAGIGVALGTLVNKIDAVSNAVTTMWEKMGVGQKGVEEANERINQSFFNLAKELSKRGVKIDWPMLQDEAYRKSLIQTAHTLREKGHAADVAADATKKLGDANKATTPTVTKLDDEVKKLLESFQNQLNPMKELEERFNKLHAQGVSFEAFVKVYGNEILKASIATKAHGEALTEWGIKASTTAKEADLLKKSIEEQGKASEELIDQLNKVKIEYESQLNPMNEITAHLHELQFAHADTTEFVHLYWEQIIEAAEAVEKFGGILTEEQKKILAQAKGFQAAAEAADDYVDAFMRALEANKEAVVWQDTLATKVMKFLSILSEGKNIVGKFADALLEGFEAFYKLLGDLDEKATNPITKWSNKTTAIVGAIGQAFITLGNVIEGAAGKILSAIGSIITGFATLPPHLAILNAVIVGVTTLFGLFGGKGKDWEKSVRNIGQALGIMIPDDVISEIAELAKKVGETTAIFLSLDKIFDEITSSNLGQAINAYTQALEAFNKESVHGREVISDLNNSINEMIEAATDDMGVLNLQMVKFIQYLQDAGIELSNLTTFLKGEINTSVEDLQRMLESRFRDREVISEGGGGPQTGPGLPGAPSRSDIENIFTGSISQFRDFENEFIALIGAMQRAGMSTLEIMQELGPSLELMQRAAEQLGIEASDAFKPFLDLQKVFTEFPRAVKDLQSVNTLLTTFNNLGILNETTFKSLENQFRRSMRAFMEDGKLSNAELTAMAPTLALLASLSEKYGITLDKATQKAIDLAKAQGILTETPVEPMTRLSDILETKLIPAMDNFTNSINHMLFALGLIPEYIPLPTITGGLPAGGPAGRSVFSTTNTPPNITLPSTLNAEITTTINVRIGNEKIDSYIDRRIQKGFIRSGVPTSPVQTEV